MQLGKVVHACVYMCKPQFKGQVQKLSWRGQIWYYVELGKIIWNLYGIVSTLLD